MKVDIKSIIMILATQCMINLGEICDPVLKKSNKNLEGAELFIGLLDELKQKTNGNLTEDEVNYLDGIIDNLKKYYKRNTSG